MTQLVMSVTTALNKIMLVLLCTIVVTILNSSCGTDETNNEQTAVYDGPEIPYSTYEIASTDIRLKCFHHPLYHMEYPTIFTLIDINLMDVPDISCDETRVQFTVQQTGIPKSKLSIIVENPVDGKYLDAIEKLQFMLSDHRSYTDNLSMSRTEVFSIPADYLVSYFVLEMEPMYPEYQLLSRSAYFDYAGTIWEISLEWYFRGALAPKVKEYWNHIITTFEILE